MLYRANYTVWKLVKRLDYYVFCRLLQIMLHVYNYEKLQMIISVSVDRLSRYLLFIAVII